MSTSTILLVGQDYRLLATRAAVLAKTHANVTCSGTAEALIKLENDAFDLVVLCHSLSEGQAAVITDAVHRGWPQTRVMMVVSDVRQERLYNGANFDATSSSEPKRLICRTAELLERLAPQPIEEMMHHMECEKASA